MILQGDALEELRKLPDKCCSVCVTSPPYYNARDYGAAEQLGTESSPEEYTRKLVEAFREVARVLKDDGTLWLNIGDSYARHIEDGGIKRKDLIGIPWLLALALRSDGWYLRADIIWNKPNAMPESAKDRPARSHEYVFYSAKRPPITTTPRPSRSWPSGTIRKSPAGSAATRKPSAAALPTLTIRPKPTAPRWIEAATGSREMKPANETAGTSGRSPHGHIRAPTSPRSRRNWPRSAYWPGANRATRFWIHSQEVEPQEPQPSKKGGTISG